MNEIAMMKARRAAISTLKYALLIFAAFVALVPIVSCVVTAFKTPEEYATTSVMTSPQNWLNFSNFITAWQKANMGKSEMWYVLEADPGAYLYYGFTHPITKEEYRRRIEENTLEEVLNAVPVKKGDLFYIPAGTVHAICKGIVIAEIQQNSNVTYRVYDHGRVGPDGKPRQLHIDKAVEVSKLELPCTKYNFGGHLVRSAYFTVDRFDAPCQISTDEESFTSLLVLDGAGAVSCGDDVLQCKKGDSLFITTDSGMSYLSGNLQVLCTRIGTI